MEFSGGRAGTQSQESETFSTPIFTLTDKEEKKQKMKGKKQWQRIVSQGTQWSETAKHGGMLIDFYHCNLCQIHGVNIPEGAIFKLPP